jgi:hypothetical protein
MTIRVTIRAAAGAALVASTLVAASVPALAAAGSTATSVPTQLSLLSVSCVSGKACVAVGERVTSSNRDLNVAEGWNGRKWVVMPAPPSPGSSDELEGVSCAKASACMAVGSYEMIKAAKPKPQVQIRNLAEFWNGRTWRMLATPNRGIGNQLTGVSCTASDRCVAAGWSLSGTIAESWNGSRWMLMTTPNPAPDIALNSVSCANRGNCVAVGGENFGQGLLIAEVWNGRSWQVHNPPSPPPTPQGVVAGLSNVSCSRPADCIATGFYLSLAKAGLPLAEQWNGKKWTTLHPITPAGGRPAGAALHAASCLRSGSCLAVGATEAQRLLGEQWNGRAWHLTSAPRQLGKNIAMNLFAVSCWQARGCMAVGNNFGVSEVTYPLAEEWNGTGWRLVLDR